MDNKWCQITITIDIKYQDLIIGQLSNIGFNGFLQDDDTLSCFIPFRIFNPTLINKFNNILFNFNKEFPKAVISWKKKILTNRNWNEEWEKNIGIVKATSTLIIKPSWKILPKKYSNKIVINIDPKMSFGTGHHETTRLTLSLIEKFITPEASVLDFGCGTAILGIACIKYGASSVVAVDNDEWAVNNATENIKLNYVHNEVRIILGGISSIPKRRYDLIVANIDYKTIIKYCHSLASYLSKNGVMIFSGVLVNDAKSLNKLFRTNSLKVLEKVKENGWLALVLSRL